MTTRIMYLEPSAIGLHDDHFAELLSAHKEPETVVDLVHLKNLPDDMIYPFLPPLPFYYSEMFRIIHQAERDGYDAVIVGCSADPGLRDAANMVQIPVIGPLKAALHLAMLTRRSVSVIQPGHSGKRMRPLTWHMESAHMYGFDRQVVSWRRATVERPAQSVVDDLMSRDRKALADLVYQPFRESVMTTALEAGRRCVEEDGAESLYFGCTLWGGLLGPIARELGVPVIDPLIGSLKVAEMLSKTLRQTRESGHR